MGSTFAKIVILQTAFFILYLLDIFCNSFLIYALWKLNKLKIRSFQFILCLSISDVLHGIFGLIEQVMIAANLQPSEDIAFFLGAGIFYFLNFSTSMVLIIGIDRFVHMKYLNKYPRVMTKCKATFIVLANVLFTLHTLITTRVLLIYHRQYLLDNRRAYIQYRITLGFFYLSLTAFIFFIYFWTYNSLRRRTKNMVCSKKESQKEKTKADKRKNRWNQGSKGRHVSRNSSTEFAKGMAFVLGSLFFLVVPSICMTPCQWLITLYADIETIFTSLETIQKIGNYTYMSSILNCSLNAAILIYFSSELNTFTRKFFCCCKKSNATSSVRTVDETKYDQSLTMTKSQLDNAPSISQV